MANDFKGLMIVAAIFAISLCVLYPIKWIMNLRKRQDKQQDTFRCPRCDLKCVTAYKTLDDKKQSNVRAGFYCKKCNIIVDDKGNEINLNG